MYPEEIVDIKADSIYDINFYLSNLSSELHLPAFNIIYKEVPIYVYYSNKCVFAIVEKNINDFFKFNISAFKLDNVGYKKEIWKLYVGEDDIGKSMLYFVHEFIDQIDNKNKDIYKPYEIYNENDDDFISSDDENESINFDEY